jgi:4-hydroxy-tetrahydrodipicolinate synthase
MIRGCIVALITPMSESGEVDLDSLGRLIDLHADAGTAAIVAVGTTGESATLDEREHCETIAHFVRLADGRLPIIAGTGANATSEAIRLTRCAKEAGADAALLVTPYYNKPTQQGLIRHHTVIAEAVAIPQILYNVPGRTACDMLPETVVELSRVPNIVGVKEATGDITRVAPLREGCGPDFAIYSGDDATCRQLMLAGADGVISVTSNVAPRLMARMCSAALAGRADEAERLDRDLAGLHRALFVQSNPIPVKWAMAELGLAPRGIRLPLTWLPDELAPQVRTAMQQAGVL